MAPINSSLLINSLYQLFMNSHDEQCFVELEPYESCLIANELDPYESLIEVLPKKESLEIGRPSRLKAGQESF